MKADDRRIVLANKLFKDKSIDVDDICASLKISKSTLYRYVRNRKKRLTECHKTSGSGDDVTRSRTTSSVYCERTTCPVPNSPTSDQRCRCVENSSILTPFRLKNDFWCTDRQSSVAASVDVTNGT